jgi:hypothetical protein
MTCFVIRCHGIRVQLSSYIVEDRIETVDDDCVDCISTHAAQGDCSTCLHVACGARHLDVVKYLCEHGGKELLMKLRYVRAVWLYVCLPVWFAVEQWDV